MLSLNTPDKYLLNHVVEKQALSGDSCLVGFNVSKAPKWRPAAGEAVCGLSLSCSIATATAAAACFDVMNVMVWKKQTQKPELR